jgi:hypothetical protein
MLNLCIRQAVGQSTPDLVVMSNANWAGLAGFLTTQRRYSQNEDLAKIGFKVIELGDTLVAFENTSEATYFSMFLTQINEPKAIW